MKEKAKQMFSLHTKKSLRLQRLGSWISYEDQNTGSTYYYNPKTGEGQWNIPSSVSSLMKKTSSLSSKSSKSVLVSFIYYFLFNLTYSLSFENFFLILLHFLQNLLANFIKSINEIKESW